MVGNSSLLYLTGTVTDEQVDSSFALRRSATRCFWRLYAGSVLPRLRALFGQRPASLLSLNQAAEGKVFDSAHQLGVTAVPIGQIAGSEGKSNEFDPAFRPLNSFSRDRWVSVAVALMQGKALPPVELIQVGEVYYVRDGHHRISVARALGQWSVDAVVTVWNLA